jgi:hypothetical protein
MENSIKERKFAKNNSSLLTEKNQQDATVYQNFIIP